MSADPHQLAAALNEACHCEAADVPALQQGIALEAGLEGSLAQSHPHLFSAIPFFVADEHRARMQALISAVETVVALPSYQELVLSAAPEIARHHQAAKGVFLGYDFHITDHGPKLIEINTNAGGALLNVQLLGAQLACCEQAPDLSAYEDHRDAAPLFVSMFQREWRAARGAQPLRRIAIVDEGPNEQYLYPEFRLFKRLFEASGIETSILDPSALRFDGKNLTCGDRAIDLVYNRLTDFYFEKSAHACLRDAYMSDAVVITPHPRCHALYANKRNLTILSSESTLRELGVGAPLIETLASGIPRTEPVLPADAQRWWTDRKHWFFKPGSGYGSRGVYRGDKLTRSTFNDIVQRGYLAQATVPPGERKHVATAAGSLKADVRNYVYDGAVQLVAARLYRGQTTNFRTPGGGFAPVFFASLRAPGCSP